MHLTHTSLSCIVKNINQLMGVKKMTDEYKPNKMEQEFLTSVKSISISLKEIKEQISIKNKIDSTKLVLELANNKTFSTLNKEQTKKVIPQFNENLKHINENIYGKSSINIYTFSPHNFWGLPLLFICVYD